MSPGGWLAENSGLVAGWQPAGVEDDAPMLLERADCDPVEGWEFKMLGEARKRSAEAVPLW